MRFRLVIAALAALVLSMFAGQAAAQEELPARLQCPGDPEADADMRSHWAVHVRGAMRRLDTLRLYVSRISQMDVARLDSETALLLGALARADAQIARGDRIAEGARPLLEQRLDLVTEARTKAALGQRLDPDRNAMSGPIRTAMAEVQAKKDYAVELHGFRCKTGSGVAAAQPPVPPPTLPPTLPSGGTSPIWPPPQGGTDACAMARDTRLEDDYERTLALRRQYVGRVRQMDLGLVERELEATEEALERRGQYDDPTEPVRLHERRRLLEEARARLMAGGRLDAGANAYSAGTQSIERALASVRQANADTRARCEGGSQQAAASEGRLASGRLRYKPMSQADANQMAGAATSGARMPDARFANLAGQWEAKAASDSIWQPLTISQAGGELDMVTEYGVRVTGRVRDASVTINGWSGWQGEIAAGGNEIRWTNGVVWRRR